MAGLEETYIVHCAETVCSYGMRKSMLVLDESHGVFLKKCAQVTIKDCKPENIINFGGCNSPENPATIAAAKAIAKDVAAETEMNFEDQVADIFTVSEESQTNCMVCFGECTPNIVSMEWDKEKEDVFVEPGKKALVGEATLTCKFGGIIKINTSGQPE